MDDQLDKYFQKARESISDPVPISEIKAKLIASSGANGSRKWLPTRFQVIIVLAVVFVALYFFIDSKIGNEAAEIDGNSAQQEEVTAQQEQEPSENVAVEASDNELPESTDQEVIALKEEEATSDVQDDETPKAKVIPAETAVASKKPEVVTEPVTSNTDSTNEPVNLYKFLVEESSQQSPEVTDKIEPDEAVSTTQSQDVNAITHHQFKILSSYSESRLKKLDKELKKYGLTLKIEVLKYGKDNKMSKFKGSFVSIETNRKTVFNVPAFNKLFLDFDYSISKGPDKMVISGK